MEIKLLNIESIAQLQQRSDEAERQLWDACSQTDIKHPDESIQVEIAIEIATRDLADTAAGELRIEQDQDAAALRALLGLD